MYNKKSNISVWLLRRLSHYYVFLKNIYQFPLLKWLERITLTGCIFGVDLCATTRGEKLIGRGFIYQAVTRQSALCKVADTVMFS